MNEVELLKSDEQALDGVFAQASLTLHKDYLGILSDEQQTRIREVPSAIQEQELSKQSRFYKIDKLMFNKDENILEKLATVFNADYYCGGTLAMMIQNDAGTVSYYLGVINKDNENEDVSIKNNGQLLKMQFEGNFPGSELKSLKNSVVRELFKNIF